MFVDEHVQVPKEYVKNNEIVLNVGFEATSALKLGNELIEFKARFGGTSREIVVPVDHVIAIYARENGQGMDRGIAGTRILQPLTQKGERCTALQCVGDRKRVGNESLGLRMTLGLRRG